MTRHPRWGIAVLGVSAIAVSIAAGVEPDGYVLWSLSPADAGGRASVVRVRLRLESVAPLRKVELRVSAPTGVPARAMPGPGSDAAHVPERTGDGALVLGDLERGQPLLLEFEFVLPRGVGGIAGFTLSGSLPDGRRVQESVGWTLASPRGPPKRRFGAVEYPAVLQPDGPQ